MAIYGSLPRLQKCLIFGFLELVTLNIASQTVRFCAMIALLQWSFGRL
jgi:hypothetical protein